MLALCQNYPDDTPTEIHSYSDLVDYLNRLNADWVRVMKRVSPNTFIELLEVTQQPVINYYHSMHAWAPARFAVAWAGEQESKNWFHIAENILSGGTTSNKAVDQEGIMDKEFFTPLIQTFMMALPHAYRHVPARDGSVISVTVSSPCQCEWRIISKDKAWKFIMVNDTIADTHIEVSGDTAWKLFTKALPEAVAKERFSISGNQELGEPIFKIISVMA